MNKMDYSILINTCDKFEDCWEPFFKLFDIYWPNSNAKIFLNTEYKNFSYKNIDITSLKVCEKNRMPKYKRATWSQCLIWALESIDSEIILYMQEDYFIKDKVKNELIDEYVELMTENSNIKCIHLTDQSVKPNGRSEYKNLDKVLYKQRYRVCCQGALWRKSELLDVLREYEDAWEFEEFGSLRSEIMEREYYVVDRSYVKLDEFEIIPYIFTGIVQGRWYEKVVPLFEKHNIKIDFNERGFVQDAPVKPFLKRVQYKINKIPKIIRNNRELTQLKKTNE